MDYWQESIFFLYHWHNATGRLPIARSGGLRGYARIPSAVFFLVFLWDLVTDVDSLIWDSQFYFLLGGLSAFITDYWLKTDLISDRWFDSELITLSWDSPQHPFLVLRAWGQTSFNVLNHLESALEKSLPLPRIPAITKCCFATF